jgi:SpoVK/Ycf46/Vps4 family AAA+-type ATPase
MTSTPRPRDLAPGYADAREHLDDLAELVTLQVERLQQLRKHGARRAVITAAERADALREVPGLAALDTRIAERSRAIASRAAYAHRLGVKLPLELLRARFELTAVDVAILGVLAVIERGTAFNPYASGGDRAEPMQPDVAFVIALVADAATIHPEDVRLRLVPDAPLCAGGLVELAAGSGWVPDAPLVYKKIRLAARVLDFIEGLLAPPRSVLGAAGRFIESPMATAELVLPDATLVDRATRSLARSDQQLLLLGPPGVGRKSVAGAAARMLGKPIVIADLAEMPVEARGLAAELAPLVREARLQDAVLVIDHAHEYGDGEGQAWIWEHLTDQLRQVAGPLAIVAEKAPSWIARFGRVPIELHVPFPDAEAQRKLWIRHLPASLRFAPGLSLDTIVKRYTISCAAIRETAEELGRLDVVHQRGGVISEPDVLEVIRGRLAHRLGGLAQVVRTTLDWPDVILPDEVMNPVFEFLNYAAHRGRVFSDWGFDRKLPYGRGLSALFSGPPGTGKTMICSLLAKELGLELYRIDLSQVVNKYIGETEKNLGKVFDEAARGQVMLLFDEADSLFAKRTEVKSSHDRFANLEVNYLLQRMESHEGVVVMTTNSETAIDPAFRRRIRFRIRFPAPDEAQRALLWQGMVPKEAQLAHDVDWKVLAQRFPLAGGNIMNALVRAATAAAAEGTPIKQEHLLRAAQLEYSEMGFLA